MLGVFVGPGLAREQTQGFISLMNSPSRFKLDWNSFNCNYILGYYVAPNFAHATTTELSWNAQKCSDNCIDKWMSTKWNFHQIWIMKENRQWNECLGHAWSHAKSRLTTLVTPRETPGMCHYPTRHYSARARKHKAETLSKHYSLEYLHCPLKTGEKLHGTAMETPGQFHHYWKNTLADLMTNFVATDTIL